MTVKTLTAATAMVLLLAAPAAAHERAPYDPDDPTTYVCSVVPDDPHRHPEDVCYDGHDPDDCALEDRTERGWCPGPDVPSDEPLDVPELEVLSDPDGITGVEVAPAEIIEPVAYVKDDDGTVTEVVPGTDEPVLAVVAEVTPAPPVQSVVASPTWKGRVR